MRNDQERPDRVGAVASGTRPGPSYVVRARYAFDGERFLDGGAQVLVTGERIVAVQPRTAPCPPGWPVIDSPDGTLLPGLIDTHVHLVAGGEADALALDVDRSAEEREQVIRRSLRENLEHGITTVRDLGDTRWAVVDRAAREGEPRVVASGPPITSPGGHCAAMGGAAEGPAELRDAVARRSERGTQVIKMVVSGGAMTAGSDLLQPQFGPDDVRVVVEEAHRRGLPVTAHAHSVPSVEVCLAAGVDGIEHCTCLTDRGIHTPEPLVRALAAARVQVCPTFGRLPGLPPSPQAVEVMRRTGMTLQARFEQVGRLFAAGVPLTAGSDAGIHPAKPHGVLAYSVAELVQSGLPVEAALSAATAVAADVCGVDAGRLRAGTGADLVLAQGDLAADVAALAGPLQVILRGRPVRLSPGGAPPAPS
ncbi:MAG TPA: amidohydrolase family protein [Kineosporiaceae bacterium]